MLVILMKNSIEEKYKNKNNLLIIYVLFASIIILSSFGDGLLNYIVMGLTYLLSNIFENVTVISFVIKYLLLILIYITLGIVSFYLFLSCFDDIKYVMIYSVIVNMAIIVLAMVIKSFFGADIIEYLIRYVFSLIAVILVFIIEFFKTRKAMNK